MDLYTAYAASRPAEVSFAGTVSSAPRYFFGTRTRCEHETFGVQTAAGPVKIVDNVGIAPPVPVHPGDRIEVRGQMVHDRDKRRWCTGLTTIRKAAMWTASFDSTGVCMHSAAG